METGAARYRGRSVFAQEQAPPGARSCQQAARCEGSVRGLGPGNGGVLLPASSPARRGRAGPPTLATDPGRLSRRGIMLYTHSSAPVLSWEPERTPVSVKRMEPIRVFQTP